MNLFKNVKILIAADGGAASGKTTGSKQLSKNFGLKLLSSGLLYRYVSLRLLSNKKKINKKTFITKITKNISLKQLKNKKLFDPEVTKYSAVIAKSKMIRLSLRKFQKNFAKQQRVCIEGRDIGTVICPKADIKLFFKCSLNVRALRRLKEYRKNNKNISLNEVKKSLKTRDYHDSTRKISALKIAKDSIVVDTTKLNKKEMEKKLVNIVRRKLINKYG